MHPKGLTRDQEAATTRRSAVWGSFTRNRPAAAGGPATATCGDCGQILRAGSDIGTSHLRRHTATKRCQQLAAEQRRRQQQEVTAPHYAAAEAPPPGGDQEDHHPMPPPVSVEEQFFVVDGMVIPELWDDLIGKGLADIDEQSEADQHLGANNYVPALPQAASSSTRRFIQKKKERKGAESKKRCAREDESGLDLSAHADLSSREKRKLPNSAGAKTATIHDHSHGSNQ